MNSERTESILADLDEWQRVQRPHELARFAPVVALSTAGGCAVVALCLWTVVPDALWTLWLTAGAVVSLAQWWSQRFIGPEQSAASDPLGRRRWILANALCAGAYWGLTTYLLFPFDSVAHQLLLAFILMAVTALWLPLFALSPVALLAFTVPGLLPMAFGLLTSPEPPQATMGSLLLMLIGIFGAAAQTTSRIFFADLAERRALYHEATHDSLVGLANRGEFHRRVQALGVAGTRPYAMLFIDLDNFKEVNDTAGHAAGDELLRRVGEAIRDTVRREDLPARLGGDEFAILMEDCGVADAMNVAATILERVNGFALSDGGRRRRVGASIGIACSADAATTPEKLLEAADQACYVAKRGGRNRIEVATPHVAAPEAAAPRRATAQRFALVRDAVA